MGLKQHTFDFFRKLVFEQSGTVLDSGKGYLVETRLAPLVRREGVAGIDELLIRLRTSAGSALAQEVVEALVTNETSFFRDPFVFESLARDVIPELMVRRRQERSLSIWSAACSSGQEPYSLAMLFHERFANECAHWKLRVTASDLSTRMLERARQGSYSKLEIGRGLSDHQIRRHFQSTGNAFQIDSRLRDTVEFRQINLVQEWPALAPFDLVLLRNVLIYMDAATRQQILGRLRAVLRPGGYVILGTTEATFDADAAFDRIDKGGLRCLQLRASPAP